jgi:hypothetical protein
LEEKMAESMSELQALANQPERWWTIDAEQLRMLTYVEINRYGITNDPDMVPRLMQLYGVLARQGVADAPS